VTGGVQNSVSFGPGLFRDRSYHVGADLQHGPRPGRGGFREARHQEAVVRYQQTVLQALRDVSGSGRAPQATGRPVASRRTSSRSFGTPGLSNIRYDGGVTSYLEVLDTERQLFEAELDLARTQRDELLAVVRLYRALGGGWVQ
jgi:multidrug efflux system outer membrane protein